jgi:hypothetical protein
MQTSRRENINGITKLSACQCRQLAPAQISLKRGEKFFLSRQKRHSNVGNIGTGFIVQR